jgi:hypothetical protein
MKDVAIDARGTAVAAEVGSAVRLDCIKFKLRPGRAVNQTEPESARVIAPMQHLAPSGRDDVCRE